MKNYEDFQEEQNMSYELRANPNKFKVANKVNNGTADDTGDYDLEDDNGAANLDNKQFSKNNAGNGSTANKKKSQGDHVGMDVEGQADEPNNKNKKVDKQTRRDQIREKVLLRNDFVRELEEEVMEKPKEVRNKKNMQEYYDSDEEAMEHLEEENFVRYRMNKSDKKKRNIKINKAAGMQKMDDFNYLNDIRKLVEMNTGTGISKDDSGVGLKKIYKNDDLRNLVAKKRELLIAKRKREEDKDEEFRGVKNKFKKFTGKKKKGGKGRK